MTTPDQTQHSSVPPPREPADGSLRARLISVAAPAGERLQGWSAALDFIRAHGTALTVLLVAGSGVFLRLVDIGTVGYNSDEAVYAGQAASLAGNPLFTPFFPVFRAHPLLFQALLSPVFAHGTPDVAGRLLGVALGLATLAVVYALGRELYGHRAGLVAALLLAVMPYHVVVTRQVLLDGPMTLFTTVTLLFLAKYGKSARSGWLVAAGASLGLAMLAKETSVVLLGAGYAFLVLTRHLRDRLRGGLLALLCTVLVFSTYLIALALAGRGRTGRSYLAWQLLRPANHSAWFYFTTVPLALGPLALVAAIGGLWWRRRPLSWRETLLLAWIIVPLAFFEAWPIKGFQYLLGISPAVAVLAARGLLSIPVPRSWLSKAQLVRIAAVGLVALSMAASSWSRVHVGGSTTFLAGSGGVPGGREAGRWLASNTPEGARIITLGPSMANILQFYGHRQAMGLSVSSNPLNRNPSYSPVGNADLALRRGEFQYVVWDAYSAARSPFFAQHEQLLARRYHGRVIHTEYVKKDSERIPVVVIYEVRS